jgi:hypothetical protein
MSDFKSFEVRRVNASEDLLHPGDYVFVAKRAPKITVERIPSEPPKGTFKRFLWHWFGRKFETKQIVEAMWPEYDAIIMNCPHCNQAIATTKDHKIESIEPLTIDKPLACAYSRDSVHGLPTVSFEIKDGKIIPA